MRRFGASLTIVLLLSTSGCSSRPSIDDVSKALRSDSNGSLLGSHASRLDKKEADCIAKILVESKLSDDGLRALMKGDNKYKASQADLDAATAVSADTVRCVTTAPTK